MQTVAEAGGRFAGDKTRLDELDERIFDDRRFEAGDRGHRRFADRAVRDCKSGKHQPGNLRDASDAGTKQRGKPWWHRLGHPRRAFLGCTEIGSDQLLGEERVASRPAVQGFERPAGWSVPEQGLDLFSGRCRFQRAERNLDYPRHGTDRREPVDRRRVDRELVNTAAHRKRNRARAATSAGDEEPQQVERRAVGPVQILDHERDGPPGG